MIENSEKQSVLLVFATATTDEIINEMNELVNTAGGVVKGVVVQNNNRIYTSTAIGSGKVSEVAQMVESMEIDLVIFDNQLSATQISNLEGSLNCRVIDRTNLILDIFAINAKTSEGKLQVELAQLKYALPRLIGSNQQLSKLGGGIGTRGPGESKLETDRRVIRRKLILLQRELESMENKRNITKQQRYKNETPTIAIVGYTNAGKSTLFNALTNSNVLAENKLFATLDPTVRGIALPSGIKAVIIDTVGFIRNIPHELVQAFKSTLNEAINADVVLNVCDSSNLEVEVHNDVTRNLLEELGCVSPIIDVYNKSDSSSIRNIDLSLSNSVLISAKDKTNLDVLIDKVDKILTRNFTEINFFFPHSQHSKVSELRACSRILKENFTDIGVEISAYADVNNITKLKEYIV